MKRTSIFLIVLAITAALGLGLAEASRVKTSPPNAKQICFELQHQIVGITPINLRLRFLELGPAGGEIYTVAGRTETSSLTNPSTETKRVISGAATKFNTVFEVSLTTSDIQDLKSTKPEEGLAVSYIHMVLDPITMEGTYEALNVFYPPAAQGGAPTSNSFSGTVTRVECYQ